MNECTFEVIKELAALSGADESVQKKLCLISWNGKPPVFDIRAWSGKGKPYKGITLDESEAKALKEALEMAF